VVPLEWEAAFAVVAAADARRYRGAAGQRAVLPVVRQGGFLAGAAQWGRPESNSQASAVVPDAAQANQELPIPAMPKHPEQVRRGLLSTAQARAIRHESEVRSSPEPTASFAAQEQRSWAVAMGVAEPRPPAWVQELPDAGAEPVRCERLPAAKAAADR
jgi:hypothetical protein